MFPTVPPRMLDFTAYIRDDLLAGILAPLMGARNHEQCTETEGM